MSTLQAHPYPESRLSSGKSVLSAAGTLEPAQRKLIAAALNAFAAAHKAYAGGQSKVDAADAAIVASHQKGHDAREKVDHAIVALANALSDDGQPRLRPFAAFKAPSPAELAHEGLTQEVSDVHALTKKVLGWKGASARTRAAANALDKAAAALAAVPKPQAKLAEARHVAIVAREALGTPWDIAFKVLKSAARIADGTGAAGVFETLFDVASATPTAAGAQRIADAQARKATTAATRAKKKADAAAKKVAKKVVKAAKKRARKKG